MAKSCSSENNVYFQVYRSIFNHRYEDAAATAQKSSKMLGYIELV